MLISRSKLLESLRSHKYAVESSTSPSGAPQSALVGVAVSDDFEIIFDTLSTSRKAENLRKNPQISFVIGSMKPDATVTIQIDGAADEPTNPYRKRLIDLYFEVFPDGKDRQNHPDLLYVRARPKWLRYSDYGCDPPAIIELDDIGLRDLQ